MAFHRSEYNSAFPIWAFGTLASESPPIALALRHIENTAKTKPSFFISFLLRL